MTDYNKLSLKSQVWLPLTVCMVIAGFVITPKPQIFVVGDSISMQYGPYLEEYFQGVAGYQRKTDNAGLDPEVGVPQGPNGGDSRMVLEYLKKKLSDPAFHPDYVLLNCGLHDIKTQVKSGKTQVSKEDYRNNLESIIHLLEKEAIQVIWVRTTPVVDSIHNAKQPNFRRYAEDLSAYNDIADEVMLASDIPSIDLYSFTRNLGVSQFIDHVHYNESTRKLQAAYIAGYFQKLID